jgi:heptosyltransferase-2
MKVLVIQIKMIGDVLASTVICEAIKKVHPESQVHYLIQKNTFAVVENNPFIDKVLFFDSKEHKGLSGLINYGKGLRKENYSHIIDAYGKWESIIPTYFSKASIRIGIQKWYTPYFYTKTVPTITQGNATAIEFRLSLANAAFELKKVSDLLPKIYLKPEEIEHAKSSIQTALDTSRKIFMISVLGSGQNKSLPNEYMAQTLDIIASNTNAQLLFNYMPNQQDEAKKIYNHCQKATKEKIVFDFYTKGLRDFIAVLSQCNALIGNEGGAVNMAKALQVPTFTIFAPWINKFSWNILEETGLHDTIHLSDYYQDMYQKKHPKNFKEKSFEWYTQLNPKLYQQKLIDYLTLLNS